MARPRAILFDLDGTITNRRRSVDAFAGRLTSHFAGALRPATGGVELLQFVRNTLVAADRWGHAPRSHFFKEVTERLPWAERVSPKAIAAFWPKHFAECTQPADSMHESIRSLQRLGIRLGVVTNGGGEVQERKLDVLGLRDQLCCVAISGVLGMQKPGARIFRHAMHALGVAPEDCWFVGDHPLHDVAGARGAGMTAVWVDHGQPWPADRSLPTYRIKTLRELLGIVGGRENRSETEFLRGIKAKE